MSTLLEQQQTRARVQGPVSFVDAPSGAVGNFELDSDAESIYTSASESGGSMIEAVEAGTGAGLDAAAAGTDTTVAATTAVEAAGISTAEVASCVTIALAPVVIITAVAGLLEWILSINELMTINVVNKTPYNIYTSSQPQYGQFYCAHGKAVTYPAGVIPPTDGTTFSGSTYAFENDDAALVGPSGAFWIQIQDPANGNVLGGLCVAYADPVTGSNSIAVEFNQNLEIFYVGFSEQPAQLASSAVLGAQTINGTSYPNLQATAGLSSLSGSSPTAFVTLSVEQAQHHGGIPVGCC